MSILAINSGSSSLKFGLFDERTFEPLREGEIEWADGRRDRAHLIVRLPNGKTTRSKLSVPDDSVAAQQALKAIVSDLSGGQAAPAITVVGHRLVHGGAAFRESVLIDKKVKAAIAGLNKLAPLHNPPALATIEAAEAAVPGVPQIAVFDTAFYSHLPAKACLYALPYEYHKDWGIRRFGFHGTSHAYCALRAAELLGRPLRELRLITCHLGSGCSATAVRYGVAVDTTMGFSPLEGLMMGTRCGSVDPGVLIHLLREQKVTLDELDHTLNHSSGLQGISGVSPDLAQIEAAAANGNKRARLAFDMFADRVRSAIGSLAATLRGLDAVIFMDRIGEHSPSLREAACDGLGFMGLKLDRRRNARARPDADIAKPDSPARILIIHTREELMVAREARRVLKAATLAKFWRQPRSSN
jgi:acetate kinase